MTKYKKLKQDYDQSGMSQKAFANSKGIAPSTVCNWLKKAKKVVTPSEFVPIHIPKGTDQIIRIVTSNLLDADIIYNISIVI